MAKHKGERCPDCGKFGVKNFKLHKPHCRPSTDSLPSGKSGVVDGLNAGASRSMDINSGMERKTTQEEIIEARRELQSSSEKTGADSGQLAGSTNQSSSDVLVASDSQINITNPPPVPQKTLPDPVPEKIKKKADEDILTRGEWEDYIKLAFEQAGKGTDAVVGEIYSDLKGVWQFKDDELKLPAVILARKLARADVSAKEAENVLLGVFGLFSLAPRVAITGVHVYKSIRDVRRKRETPQPAPVQIEEPAPIINVEKEEMMKQWMQRKPNPET